MSLSLCIKGIEQQVAFINLLTLGLLAVVPATTHKALFTVGITTRTNAHVEIAHSSTLAHFLMGCTIRAWKARGHGPSALQGLMMNQAGKCVISTWAWVLAFIP